MHLKNDCHLRSQRLIRMAELLENFSSESRHERSIGKWTNGRLARRTVRFAGSTSRPIPFSTDSSFMVRSRIRGRDRRYSLPAVGYRAGLSAASKHESTTRIMDLRSADPLPGYGSDFSSLAVAVQVVLQAQALLLGVQP